MPVCEVVSDACCTLNLLATGRDVAIVRALEWQLLDTPQVSKEPMFLWTRPNEEDGLRGKRPTSTSTLREEGLLATRVLDTEALVDAFVEAAVRISDADASCIALAGVLGIPLLSDDGKERRVARELFPAIELISTLDALHEASVRLHWDQQDLERVAQDLRWGGNFAPLRRDPRAGWYSALLRST